MRTRSLFFNHILAVEAFNHILAVFATLWLKAQGLAGGGDAARY
jgi:hypothetical protein